MDLNKFSKYYKIVTQEPVDILYDVEFFEDMYLDDDGIHSVIDKYIEQDDRIVRNEEIIYFIHDLNGREIFFTISEEELIRKMKELMEELDDGERL